MIPAEGHTNRTEGERVRCGQARVLPDSRKRKRNGGQWERGKAMKLVTLMDDAESSARLGVLVEGDSKILDLQGAEERRRVRPASAYQSMQHLIEGGDRALDRARAIAADHDR